MVKHLELTVRELLLDVRNPRLGAVESQSKALEKLIQLNPDHFRNMMLSIKKDGLDPGDSFYVIEAKEEEGYIALDGNRRLSALLVLTQPDLLDGTDLSAKIKSQLLDAVSGTKFDELRKIRCVCFEGRKSANEWIEKRHTGSRAGEGRITWGPTEKQRFTDDGSVIDVLDFVEKNADFKPEEWESTRSTIEGGKSSTLKRLLDSETGREYIGISTDPVPDGRKTPLLSRDPEWAAPVLKKIIEDVRDEVIDSRSLNKTSDIVDYFKNLRKEFPPSDKKTTPMEFKEINLKTAKKPIRKSSKAQPTTAKAPRLRKTLAPKNNPFNTPTSPKGQRLLVEATMINADNLTISAAAVLRAFLELALNEYIEKNSLLKARKGQKGPNLTLSQKATLVKNHIVEENPTSKAAMLNFEKNVVNNTAPASIQSLHGFVHGKYQIPTPEAVRACWDSCVPVFEATFEKV